MRKLILASAAAVIFAAPAFAQNQGPTSTDPDPQVRNEVKRDPQQSGGGAVQSGQGGLIQGQGTPRMGTQGNGFGGTAGQGSGMNTQDGRDDSRDNGIAPSPGHPKYPPAVSFLTVN
jgi:hypothetical protein